MHHFIFPSKDTFISSQYGLRDKNFGITEILQLGTANTVVRTLSPTKDYVYTTTIFLNQGLNFFEGIFTGSISGTVADSNGQISGSNIVFSASYFSGSVDGIEVVGSGSFGNVISGSAIVGALSGSLEFPFSTGIFTGQLTGSNGCLNGTGSGTDTQNTQNWISATTKFIERSLLQFDLTKISASIADGTITSPAFFLNVKIASEYQLPIAYTVYALPISQSWNMGNGYLSDGGSDTGVNWDYLDNNDGNTWYSSSISTPRPPIDFISNPSISSASFAYGGGTFYTSSWCSQSFNYESSDIDMDVTPMVMAWINGSIPNNGLLLIHSDELQSTGSGFVLKFFSRDTNTIYSPYLDIAWDDVSSTFITGSIITSSISFATASSGISASIQSGSTFQIAGGVNGTFSGSAVIQFSTNIVSVVNQNFAGVAIEEFSGSFTGSIASFQGAEIDSVSGIMTGSSQIFSSSYFSGSIDGNIVQLSGSVSGSQVGGIISGSIITQNAINGFQGNIFAQQIILFGNGSGTYIDTVYYGFDGVMATTGLSGNISGLSIFGTVDGTVTISSSLVNEPCGNTFLAQLATGSIESGIFSGSTFTAYYIDHQFENGFLTGSWNPEAFYGSQVDIIIPSGIDPYAYGYVTGPYVSGHTLGLYSITGSTAQYNGQFIDGALIGGSFVLFLSGSVITSSYVYTSSVVITSSAFFPLNTNHPFTVTLQNVRETYKAGDIAKIGVFGRKQFPLKTFGKYTQQVQYLIAEYLPTSSYYALKDNETGEIVINFDSYTGIGCEYPGGNYFVIDTTSLPQERYYRILIRIDNGQSVYTTDTGKTFKITR